MKHNIPAPGTGEIESLIASTFDALPGPDPVRLQALRDGLEPAKTATPSQKSSSKLPWWAVLLLTGGLAMAGIWLVEHSHLSKDKSGQTVPQSEHSTRNQILNEQNRHMEPYELDDKSDVGNPVIFQHR